MHSLPHSVTNLSMSSLGEFHSPTQSQEAFPSAVQDFSADSPPPSPKNGPSLPVLPPPQTSHDRHASLQSQSTLTAGGNPTDSERSFESPNHSPTATSFRSATAPVRSFDVPRDRSVTAPQPSLAAIKQELVSQAVTLPSRKRATYRMFPIHITCTGTSTLYHRAERAVLSIGISSEGKSQDNVGQEVTTATNDLRAKLKEMSPKTPFGKWHMWLLLPEVQTFRMTAFPSDMPY